jgi:hypothetical protein
MKSFYSIIKITPNSLSDENLSIGMIVSDRNGFKWKFSKYKKQIAKSLVEIDNSLIDFLEREIEKKLRDENLLLKQSKEQLFDIDNLLTSEYFKYLSNYSNGILKFSNPKYIAKDISEREFIKLYSLFVDNKEDMKVVNPNAQFEKAFYNRVNTNLIEKVKDRVHTNVKFDSKTIPAIMSFEMDCIGLNGAFIGAKALPFTQVKETLIKNVNTYISVIAQLSISHQKNLKDNQFFLIADEPLKKNTNEAKYWNQLRKNESILSVIPSSDSALVAELIESKNAHKFL